MKGLFNKKLNNNGFSLVELLVAVAILGVIVVPIMRSFTTSSITSAKAQAMQNATSVAEKVMETVRSFPGKDIITFDKVTPTKTDSSGNPVQDAEGNDITYNEYRYSLRDQTATSGEKYDVYVEFSDDNYGEEETPTIVDVSDINSVGLPELYAINSEKHIVISWEINNYDASAVENLAYKANASKDDVKNFGTKTTVVNLTGGAGTDISAVCSVNYKYVDPSDTSKVTELNYNVFNKNVSDIPIAPTKKGSGGPHLYLLYTTSKQMNSTYYFENEVIKIDDSTQTPSDGVNKYKQDMYIIMQKSSLDPTPNNPKVILSGTALNPESSSTGDEYVKDMLDGTWEVPTSLTKHNSWEINKDADIHSYLYTNFNGADPNPSNKLDPTLFKLVEKDRIYDVKVKVYKAGTYNDSEWPSEGDGKKKLAELDSTMRVR